MEREEFNEKLNSLQFEFIDKLVQLCVEATVIKKEQPFEKNSGKVSCHGPRPKEALKDSIKTFKRLCKKASEEIDGWFKERVISNKLDELKSRGLISEPYIKALEKESQDD